MYPSLLQQWTALFLSEMVFNTRNYLKQGASRTPQSTGVAAKNHDPRCGMGHPMPAGQLTSSLQICETSPKPDGSCKSEGGGERVDMEARFETHFPGGWKGGACWSLAREVEMQGFLFCGPGRFSRDSEFIQEGTVQLSGSLLS